MSPTTRHTGRVHQRQEEEGDEMPEFVEEKDLEHFATWIPVETWASRHRGPESRGRVSDFSMLKLFLRVSNWC